MIKLLLLSAGTNACYNVAKKLKENFYNDFYIVGTDINEQYLIPTCKYLDKFFKVPPVSADSNYYNIILDICAKEKINYILPSFDEDQKLFYPENKDLLNLKIISFGTNKDTLKVYENKLLMNNFLQKNGFKTPKHYNLDELKDDILYFVKPINGVGSQNAQTMDGFHIKQRKDEGVIIQEKCNKPEITLECFNYNGALKTIARERIAAKSGVCTKTFIYNSDELHNIAKMLATKLLTPFCFNLQFMKNSNNEFVITDVNLRLAGGMSLSAAAGWDEVCALAKIMLKKSKEEILTVLPDTVQPQYVVRAYTDIVTKVEKPVVAFDLDGTLLDSRKRHQVVLNDILKQHSIGLNASDLIEFKRNNKSNVDYLVSKGIEEKLAKEIQYKWINHIEDKNYLKLDYLYPDANILLERYKENTLILITARANEDNAKEQIEKIGLANKFEKIFIVQTGKESAKRKAEILKKENAVLMVGDTVADCIAAKLAGIEFLHTENGFHCRKAIKEACIDEDGGR